MTEHRREYYRTYYNEHKEQLRERQREYSRRDYRKHKQERLEQAKVYKQEHRDKINELTRQWKHEHSDFYRDHYRNRYANDIVFRSYRKFSRYRHMDRDKGLVPDNIDDYPTKEEYVQMFRQPCVFCGESDWHKIGLDRIDNSLGHVRGNLQPCCWSCNKKKNKMTNEEFKKRIADGRIKLKDVSVAVPAMPTMRSLLTAIISENRPYLTVQPAEHVISLKSPKA